MAEKDLCFFEVNHVDHCMLTQQSKCYTFAIQFEGAGSDSLRDDGSLLLMSGIFSSVSWFLIVAQKSFVHVKIFLLFFVIHLKCLPINIMMN